MGGGESEGGREGGGREGGRYCVKDYKLCLLKIHWITVRLHTHCHGYPYVAMATHTLSQPHTHYRSLLLNLHLLLPNNF